MKTYKVHTTKSVFEVKAEKYSWSATGNAVFFVVGKQPIAAFIVAHLIAILEG